MFDISDFSRLLQAHPGQLVHSVLYCLVHLSVTGEEGSARLSKTIAALQLQTFPPTVESNGGVKSSLQFRGYSKEEQGCESSPGYIWAFRGALQEHHSHA